MKVNSEVKLVILTHLAVNEEGKKKKKKGKEKKREKKRLVFWKWVSEKVEICP